MPTKQEVISAVLSAMGLSSDPGFTVSNAVTAAYDAGVDPNQIVSVASVTRDPARFSSSLSALVASQLAAIAAGTASPVASFRTPEQTAGVPAGTLGSPTAQGSPAPPSGMADRIAQLEQSIGLSFLGATADGRIVMRDPISGDQFIFDDTGSDFVLLQDQRFGGSGSALGFGQLAESARQFDVSQNLRERQFAEDTRQFGVNEAFRRDQLRQQGQQFAEDLQFQRGVATGFIDGTPTLARDQFGESIRQFDISTAEGAEMNRAELAEAARRANLQAATSAFGDVTRLAPQMGQLALDQSRFGADILRQAPDFLARAFFQQGGTSPLPQVGQADILNALRENIQQINSTLGGFNPQIGAFQPPAAFNAAPNQRPVTPPPPTAVQPMPSGGQAFDSFAATPQANARPIQGEAGGVQITNPGGTNIGFSQEVLDMMSSNPSLAAGFGFKGMADGGTTTEPVVVGEEGPELAIPMGPMVVLNEEQLGFNPKKMVKAKKAANGGIFGFNVPSIPTLPSANQGAIQDLERSVRPPAINQIMQGGLASSPRFGFDLFTPQQIRSLTPETRQALGTTLATQFNETLENVDFAQQQRFGPTRNRGRAQQIAGFI